MIVDEILEIDPRVFKEKTVLEEKILLWFKLCDAFWMHDGDPQRPHAELTSGLCSNGYFNCPEVLKYPNLNEILANALVQLLRNNGLPNKVDWVIGSPYAAITFSYEVAKALGAVHGFAEKDSTYSKEKKMLWKRMTIPKDSIVLQVEELITTSGTFREIRRAVIEGNAELINFLPFVGTLVHRPPKLPTSYKISGEEIKVVGLVETEVWALDPSECPLCRAGSVRYRPKTHWLELVGKK